MTRGIAMTGSLTMRILLRIRSRTGVHTADRTRTTIIHCFARGIVLQRRHPPIRTARCAGNLQSATTPMTPPRFGVLAVGIAWGTVRVTILLRVGSRTGTWCPHCGQDKDNHDPLFCLDVREQDPWDPRVGDPEDLLPPWLQYVRVPYPEAQGVVDQESEMTVRRTRRRGPPPLVTY